MGFIRNIFGRIRIVFYIGEKCQLLKDMKAAFYKERKFSDSLFCTCKNICRDEPELDKLKHAKSILEQQSVFSQCNTNDTSNLLTIVSILISVIAVICSVFAAQLSKMPNGDNKWMNIISIMYDMIPIMEIFLGGAFIMFFTSILCMYDRRMRAYFYSIVCDEIEERKATSTEPYIKVEITKRKEVELDAETNLHDI